MIRPGGRPPAVVVGSLGSGLSPFSVSKSRAYSARSSLVVRGESTVSIFPMMESTLTKSFPKEVIPRRLTGLVLDAVGRVPAHAIVDQRRVILFANLVIQLGEVEDLIALPWGNTALAVDVGHGGIDLRRGHPRASAQLMASVVVVPPKTLQLLLAALPAARNCGVGTATLGKLRFC